MYREAEAVMAGYSVAAPSKNARQDDTSTVVLLELAIVCVVDIGWRVW